MSRRKFLSIISTVFEEAIIVAAALWGLPLLKIRIPIWGLILIMLAWAAYSVFTFRLGSRALLHPEPTGVLNMVGCRGEVVRPLNPEGQVKIRGELWAAESGGVYLGVGKEIIVVGQNRLKLVVRAAD